MLFITFILVCTTVTILLFFSRDRRVRCFMLLVFVCSTVFVDIVFVVGFRCITMYLRNTVVLVLPLISVLLNGVYTEEGNQKTSSK